MPTPDDPEVSCGGTLAHWKPGRRRRAAGGGERRRQRLTRCATDPAELTGGAAREVDAAAGVLGLAGVERMGLPDGEVTNDLRCGPGSWG